MSFAVESMVIVQKSPMPKRSLILYPSESTGEMIKTSPPTLVIRLLSAARLPSDDRSLIARRTDERSMNLLNRSCICG